MSSLEVAPTPPTLKTPTKSCKLLKSLKNWLRRSEWLKATLYGDGDLKCGSEGGT